MNEESFQFLVFSFQLGCLDRQLKTENWKQKTIL
jgi:hypothetical protein